MRLVLFIEQISISFIILNKAFILYTLDTETCSTTNGRICMFPFTYNGKYRENCIMDDMDSPWCETTDDSWGLCESSCSIEGKHFIVKSAFLPC